MHLKLYVKKPLLFILEVSTSIKANGLTPKLSDNPNKPPPGHIFVPKGDVYITRHWYESSKNLAKCPSNDGQSKFDECVRKKAIHSLCKIPKTLRCPELTICKDRRTNERLGIHCCQSIVEVVKADAALTGKFN